MVCKLYTLNFVYYENKFIPCQNSINENKQNLKCRAYKPLKVHIYIKIKKSEHPCIFVYTQF